jgi:hypothetical protein
MANYILMIVKKILAKAFECKNINSIMYILTLRRFHIDGNNFCRLLSFKDGIAWRHAYSAGSLHDKAIYVVKNNLWNSEKLFL